MTGLTSLPRKKNIKGQPHKLAYITEAESDLLKSMGGAGKPRKGTKGVPSYDFPDYGGEFDDYDPSEADTIGGLDDTLGVTDPQGNIDDPTGVGGGRGGDIESTLDDIYGSIDPRASRGRAGSYADFMSDRGQAGSALLDEYFAGPESFRDTLEMELEKGPVPSNVVTNTFGLPIETTYGYLTMENRDPGRIGYDPKAAQRDREQEFDFLTRQSRYREQLANPELELLKDPVIQEVLTKGPKASTQARQEFTRAVRPAALSMTPEQRLGTFDPRTETLTGGYLQTLENYGLPTYMGGFRGSRETEAPFALTKEEANRYQDVFMAFAGTKGGSIRAAIDAAKPGQTVEDVLGFRDSLGLPAKAQATALANYMDREALKGWVQGLGIVTSMTSPFMVPNAIGLTEEIYQDTVKPALSSLKETLNENIPGFKALSEKFDIGVEAVQEQYEEQVPETQTVVDTIFDAMFGKGKSQEAAEFGIQSNLPTIEQSTPEVTIEDVAPISPSEVDLEQALQAPDNMLVDIAGRENMGFFGPPTLESYLESIQELPMTDPISVPNTLTSAPEANTTGMLFDPNYRTVGTAIVEGLPPGYVLGSLDPLEELPIEQTRQLEMLRDPIASQMQEAPVTLDEAIAFGQALERDRDLQEQVNRQLEETVFLDPLTFPFPERPLELPPIPETIAEALQDQRGREASIARDAALQNIPVELSAPISPVQVAPLEALAVAVPETERAVERVSLQSEIDSSVRNQALNEVENMINQPGSVTTIEDYRAIENARTTEEFRQAVQTVIDKDAKFGPAAKAEAESRNYRTPKSDPTLEMLRDPISSSLAEQPLTLDEAIMLSEIPPTL